jgi:hypothetical protein
MSEAKRRESNRDRVLAQDTNWRSEIGCPNCTSLARNGDKPVGAESQRSSVPSHGAAGIGTGAKNTADGAAGNLTPMPPKTDKVGAESQPERPYRSVDYSPYMYESRRICKNCGEPWRLHDTVHCCHPTTLVRTGTYFEPARHARRDKV